MKVILHPYHLELKNTFTISRRSYNSQATLIVELQDKGVSGYGEATANPYYNMTVEKITKDIRKEISFIESLSNETPEYFWKKLASLFSENKFALCALDEAFNDLFARKKQKKLYDLWGYNINKNPLTNYTIGIDSVEKMILKMKAFPWPIYKIKLGTKDDIKIVTELRKHTNAIFRVDANCGWTADETIKNAIKLKKLGVEFIEQPLKADNINGSEYVYKNSILPIIADESCIVENDVVKCKNRFHGINIKLTKCGGLTPARRMIQEAKTLGMKTMVGCMTESSVGISAIAHLLPVLDYVDMDGALLLKKDIANGVKITQGIVTYTKEHGTGVSLQCY